MPYHAYLCERTNLSEYLVLEDEIVFLLRTENWNAIIAWSKMLFWEYEFKILKNNDFSEDMN